MLFLDVDSINPYIAFAPVNDEEIHIAEKLGSKINSIRRGILPATLVRRGYRQVMQLQQGRMWSSVELDPWPKRVGKIVKESC